MAKKGIVFLRVSSAKQTLEQQEDVMLEVALKDFKQDELLIIKGTESATKNDIDNRQTLTDLNQAIEEYNTIERVYFFAVDRLSRRVKDVISIVDDLTKRGIDCYFHNNYGMHTMHDGKENQMASMMLFFLAKGAEMEGQLRAERINAKRALMRSNNQVITGTVLFGYKKNEDKTIGIDEDNAKVIRYIFNEYVKGEKSCTVLGKELADKGVFENKNKHSNMYRIKDIIDNNAYSGGKPKKGNNVYPPIVSKELQEQCQKVKSNAHIKPTKTTSKNVYFGKSIIKEKVTNRMMTPALNSLAYRLSHCDSKLSIGINVMDSIIWHEAQMYYSLLKSKNVEDTIKVYKANIADNETKIKVLQKEYSKLEASKERLVEKYAAGKIPSKMYDTMYDTTIKKQADITRDIAALSTEIESYNKMLESKDFDTRFADTLEAINGMSDSTKKEFINEVFNTIYVSKVDDVFTIEIQLNKEVFNGLVTITPTYEYWVRGGVMHLYQVAADGTKTDVSKIIKRRFKRQYKA